MRYLLVLCVVAAAVALVGCGGAGGSKTTASGSGAALNARPKGPPPNNAPWSSPSKGKPPKPQQGRSVNVSQSRKARGGATIPACRPADYHLREPFLNGATGAIVSGAAVRSRSDSPCQLHITLHFAVRHPDGSLARQIQGNPARAAVDARLAPGRFVSRGWSWRNWCGWEREHHTSRPPRIERRPYRFRFTASAGGRSASVGVSPPRCDSPRAPSTLRRFGPHQAP
jgi:hypothetical protein